MNITKRITKFLLIAALAIPAWTSTSAQKPTAPPEMAPTENQVREKAKDLKGLSVATRNSESRSVGKSVSINASNAIKLSTPISKVKVSTAPDGPKVKGVKPVNAVNSDAKTGQPRRTSAPQLKAPELRTDVPDGYALIVFVANDVWGDGTGYQMLLDKDATMYDSWYSASSSSSSPGMIQSQDIYNMADYKIPENADYDANGNVSNFLLSQTEQILVPAGTYDILIANPTPGSGIWLASANGNIGGRINDYAIAAGKVYTFTVSLGSDSHDQTDVEITSVADMLETPTNLVADPGVTSANISWEAGMNNEGWNLRWRPYLGSNWDFEDSSMSGWTTIDADGDGYSWVLGSASDGIYYNGNNFSGLGHSPQDMVISGSYTNYTQTALTPNNYLVSPKVKLGGTITFWAKGQDPSYASEVFGVAVSTTSNTSAANFTMVGEQKTATANWTQYTFDLSAYAGQEGYVAIRHYDVTNEFLLDVDDIVIEQPGNEWIYVDDATNPYTITGLTPETQYEVQVQGVGNNTTTEWTNSVIFTTLESIDPTTELDFGSVDVESSKTLSAYIANDSDSPVTAAVTVAPNPPFSVAGTTSTTVTLAANTLTSIPVKFTPTEARNYTGTLTVVAGDVTTTIPLKGVGTKSGPEAIRDEAFFEGIEYNWTDSVGTTHTSTLNEIATDPDQIIAMLKEVYTNKTIPGNFKRGYTENGSDNDRFNVVTYTGVGKVNSSGQYVDSYGWNIPGTVKSGTVSGSSGSSYTYYYMQEDQYKPDDEGVTLLLLEIVDNFTPTSTGGDPTHDYAGLRGYFKKAIKSARVVTEAKRVGDKSDYSSATLFKIDCNKMNKFYLIAKGQLGWLQQRYQNIKSTAAEDDDYYDFYGYPMYLSYDNSYLDIGLHSNYLDVEPAFLCHMFEQLSPAEGNSTAPLTDGYQMFVTEMKSFGIIHDCPNVPYVLGTGHHFMMYGQDSPSEDCQDIRDMMLLVPDYRMMNWTGRGSTSSTSTSTDGRRQDYFYYHQSHQPKIGVFVIHQNPITGAQTAYNGNENNYKLHLTWTSNLLDYLPDVDGQYDLYRVITNADGTKTYQKVGQFNSNTFAYDDNVPMQQTGQQVTYVVQGRDVDGFLSLQMSNEESFIIPGLDRAEQLRIDLNSDYYFSRYDAGEQKNYYSNSLIANNTVGTNVKPAYIENGSEFKFWRATLKTVDGATVVDTDNAVNFVTATVENYTETGGGRLRYGNWSDDQVNFSSKPYGHGYHANPTTSDITIVNGEVKFAGLKLYDNFCVSVEDNSHPALYVYYVTLETAVPFDLNVQGTETSTHARSNTVNVPVYKAEMVMKPITAAQVEADVDHKAPAATKFELDARYSSKSEILGYYIYRWADAKTAASARSIYDSQGEDESPQGQAGNQGEYYTVAMNTDYTAETEHFASDFADVTATFLDNFMNNEAEEADTYTYAPVVELFAPAEAVEISTGADRDDYNTYGGPQQMTAGGLITIKPGKPIANEDVFTAEVYDTEAYPTTAPTCKYYYIPVTINVDVPNGYSIYKVRAWRQVDKQWLGEKQAQSSRVSNDYLFDTLDDAAEEVDVFIGNTTSGGAHNYKGLFGAKSLASDESFDANFIVRVYFTKPSKDGEARYYIAEKQQIVNVNSENIITGVVNVKGNKQVAGVKYYNMAGIESDQPFDGVNIVVTRYTDGSTSTTKVMK